VYGMSQKPPLKSQKARVRPPKWTRRVFSPGKPAGFELSK
jgi:hypothetical protein